MTRTLFSLLFPLTLTFACGDDDCPPGQMVIGAACVASPNDSGPLSNDGGDDSGSMDSGPLGEVCNGIDDDSDGQVDEADPELGAACGEDVGACTVGVQACVDGALVCDGATAGDEVCNGIDDDCDGNVDENVQFTFYLDEDLDTFGGDTTCDACAVAECGEGNWVAVGGDCDDTCETCFEGGEEVCDGFNNDCDEGVDEDLLVHIYPDVDGDGFGTGEGALACEAAGFTDAGGDCADDDARAFPGATEYYSTPIMGATDGPAYDFNCDGTESLKHNACGSASSCLNNACYNVVTLDCGDENQLRPTVFLSGNCITQGTTTTATQVECR